MLPVGERNSSIACPPVSPPVVVEEVVEAVVDDEVVEVGEGADDVVAPPIEVDVGAGIVVGAELVSTAGRLVVDGSPPPAQAASAAASATDIRLSLGVFTACEPRRPAP